MSLPRPRGELSEVGYPELLQHMHRHRQSGVLRLRKPGMAKSLSFQDGRLVFARSTNPNDRLGEFLLREGRLDLRQYLESAARIEPGRRQGAILCEMGAISPDDLLRCVREQVFEIVCSLFEWSIGEYEIAAADPGDPADSIVLSIPIEDVTLRGVRRVRDWDRIWRGVGESLAAVLAPTSRAGNISYHAHLTHDESHILALVNGQLTLGRILELSYATDFETCRTLWALLLLGAVERVTAGHGPAMPAEDYALAELVESYDRVFSAIHEFVAERLQELVDHVMDRVVADVAVRHPTALGEVHLRNQGRVEYEQVFANLARQPEAERHQRARAALDDLLDALVEHAIRELGPDEEDELTGRLRMLVGEVADVPLGDLLERRAARQGSR